MKNREEIREFQEIELSRPREDEKDIFFIPYDFEENTFVEPWYGDTFLLYGYKKYEGVTHERSVYYITKSYMLEEVR